MKNKLDGISQASSAPSTPAVSGAPVQGVRKRTMLIIAATLGVLFGGSCDGCGCNFRWKGKQLAGCSSVDPGSEAGRRDYEEVREQNAREEKEKGLNY